MVHYGDACMSQVKDIPVYYSFGYSVLDIDCLMDSLRERFGGTQRLVLIGCYFPRTIYLGYDLSFSHCIDKVYEELKQHFANVLKGEVVHSQNLSYSEHFDSEYIRFGYHYFKTATRDPNGILVFLCKDNTDVSNYFVNGNLYSVLLDSGLSQALAFTDSQLMAVVLMNFDVI